MADPKIRANKAQKENEEKNKPLGNKTESYNSGKGAKKK